MTQLILLCLLIGEKPFIPFYDHEIHKPGLLAISQDHVLCLAVPWNKELFFFNHEGQRIAHHKKDSDAPDGFREITTLGYHRETNQFYVYDFGRKLSLWSTQGAFIRAVLLKPLLYNPKLRGSHLFYGANDNGSLGSEPSLMVGGIQLKSAKSLFKVPALKKVNGYEHKFLPGPPVKMPWHHQLLIAAGKSSLAACYNGSNEMLIYDLKTLQKKHTVPLKIPAVEVDDIYYKDTLKQRAELNQVHTSKLKIPSEKPYHSVPTQILMDSEDRIFVYSHHFEGFLRLEYTASGKLVEKKKVPLVPACISSNDHYLYVVNWGVFRTAR